MTNRTISIFNTFLMLILIIFWDSSFLFAEPLVTVLFAVTFLEEKLNLFTVAGGLLIFIGVYLVTTK